jgi:hypothetical protein
MWEQSGHTDMVALHAMLAWFVKMRLPVLLNRLNKDSGRDKDEAMFLTALFNGLNEVLQRQHGPPDSRHPNRWLAVFEGHYVKHLGWPAAYKYASERLAGTSAAGGKEAMKKSYQLFARRSKTMVG